METINAENFEIQGSTIVSTQGLPIVSLLDKSVNDGIISAMSAAIQSVGMRAAEELKRGKLKRILLEGDEGTMIMTAAGENAILVTLAQKDASLGVIFMLMESLAKKVAAILDD
jgi:predicted regulator of Ras-like GTPase activity (Roadblock/LC7/MglB family)